MKNFRHNGKVITRANAGAVVGGQPIVIGTKAGVATSAYGAGVEGEYAMAGVFSLASEAGLVQGDQVGWDNGASQVVDDVDVAKDFDLGYVTKSEVGGIVEVMINGQSS
ncbi:MAG: DUF2190 family protein [Proteobacteria bacterium]|nr:DUF2190 family protein [Pseudomonadota bacterium]